MLEYQVFRKHGLRLPPVYCCLFQFETVSAYPTAQFCRDLPWKPLDARGLNPYWDAGSLELAAGCHCTGVGRKICWTSAVADNSDVGRI